jgi:non-specific serine/threonine protein kinase
MKILHFEIVRSLGAGGMGEVELARDTKLGREVALKFLPEDFAKSEGRLERLVGEARSLAALNHPGIVTIYSVEKEGDRVFLVMEYVDGETLGDRLARRPFKLGEFLDVAIALADALAAAHERRIIHRDLKPSNVMLTQDGAPKILDFGLAKLAIEKGAPVATDATTDALTREGRVVGTPSYMSPEQLEGRTIDQRSDIFSLGMILYRMATGRAPFEGDSEAEIVSAILRDTPEPVDAVRPELPHHLGRLLRLCLEKDVDLRLQSARDLRNELIELRRELTSGEIDARPLAERQPRTSSRSKELAYAAAVVVVVVVAILGVGRIISPESDRSPLSTFSEEARDLLEQGHSWEMRGDTSEDLEEAEMRYRRALALEPDEPLIQARLALVLARQQMQYAESERADEIQTLLARAGEAEPELALIHIVEGVMLLLAENGAGAEAEARRAIEIDREDYRGYSLLGKALIKKGSPDAGLRELERGVELAPAKDVRARLALAVALKEDLEKVNEAAAQYERILDYNPDYPNALNNLAVIYGESGREVDAIPLLEHLFRVRRYEAAANNLAMIYMRQGRLDKSVEWLKKAREIAPEKPIIAHTLGEVYELAGDREASRSWYETALEGYAREVEAGGERAKSLGLRGVCAAKLGRFDEARRDIDEALGLTPEHPTRLFNAAQIYALAGDRGETFRYVRLAIDSGKSRADFLEDAAFAAYRESPEFLTLVETR